MKSSEFIREAYTGAASPVGSNLRKERRNNKTTAKKKVEELVTEVTRRDFLKGMGAAAVGAVVGTSPAQAKSNIPLSQFSIKGLRFYMNIDQVAAVTGGKADWSSVMDNFSIAGDTGWSAIMSDTMKLSFTGGDQSDTTLIKLFHTGAIDPEVFASHYGPPTTKLKDYYVWKVKDASITIFTGRNGAVSIEPLNLDSVLHKAGQGARDKAKKDF